MERVRGRIIFHNILTELANADASGLYQSVLTESNDGRNGESLAMEKFGDAVDAATAAITLVASLNNEITVFSAGSASTAMDLQSGDSLGSYSQND